MTLRSMFFSLIGMLEEINMDSAIQSKMALENEERYVKYMGHSGL